MTDLEKAIVDLDAVSGAYRHFLELHDNVFDEPSLEIIYALISSGKTAWEHYVAISLGELDHEVQARTPHAFI